MQSRLDLAAVVMEQRRALGLTHSELAAKLGTSTKFVYELEVGRQEITLRQLEDLFRLLELEVSFQPTSKPKAARKPSTGTRK